MKTNTLQYYMHDGPAAFRFELSGSLTGEGARRLEQDWQTASSVIGGRMLIVDMTFVTHADEAGRELLTRWHSEGACLITANAGSRSLAETIVGKTFREFTAADHTKAGQTWAAFRSVFVAVVASALLLLPIPSQAANLKPETAAAWNRYVQSATAAQQERCGSGETFLWIDQNPEMRAKVHEGEDVVVPGAGHNPIKVPGGLIHHWIAAAFVPGAKLDHALEVLRDYDRYPQFYSPTVIESKAIAHDGLDDRFSMRLINKSFLMKMALDADYQSTNVRLDRRRSYSISKTTKIQEVEDFGQPDAHPLPEGEGGGYIWKLLTITRLAERDGGLYIEAETSALSREIPAALRLVVDPIVRRVCRESMELSIHQTAAAVRNDSTVLSSTAKANTVHNR